MNLGLVEKIVNAVLYEGYILYPYRASAVKNRQRWNFGIIYPREYSLAQRGAEASSMQTECLVLATPHTGIEVRVRFLHLMTPQAGESRAGRVWQEAIEREIAAPDLDLKELVSMPRRATFAFPVGQEITLCSDANDRVDGQVLQNQRNVEGEIEITAEPLDDPVFKIAVRITNLTPLADAGHQSRDEVLMRSLVSTHTILGADSGEFISLLDPPEACREAAAGCRNVGTWPVLVGEEGEHNCLLSSPIILYDHPRIAPESPGDFFDGTEIDELLTLRIMTLTDDEKQEMRLIDDRARQILERIEKLPSEQLMKLHGAMRRLQQFEGEKHE